MDPFYEDPQARIFMGDTRELLTQLTPEELPLATVVLTDPPYAAWKHIDAIQQTNEMSLHMDMLWHQTLIEWVSQWIPQLRKRTKAEAVGWFFCNLHYLGFYLRWAKLTGWPVRDMFALGEDEFLLRMGPAPLDAAALDRVSSAVMKNAYGQDKSVPMLETLLAVSPAGLVLDPFMGGGSTLMAARMMGRAAVGIELLEEFATKAAGRLRDAQAPPPAAPRRRSTTPVLH